jgi:hypothetical protein
MSDWHNEHDAAVLQHIASRLDEEGAWDRARRVRLALDHIAHLTAKLRVQALEYLALDQQATEALERAVKAEEEARKLRGLLRRYRKETPLGHQPHMIAAEVDAALKTGEPSHD